MALINWSPSSLLAKASLLTQNSVKVHYTHLSYVTNRTHQVLSTEAVSAKWRHFTHLPSEKWCLLVVVSLQIMDQTWNAIEAYNDHCAVVALQREGVAFRSICKSNRDTSSSPIFLLDLVSAIRHAGQACTLISNNEQRVRNDTSACSVELLMNEYDDITQRSKRPGWVSSPARNTKHHSSLVIDIDGPREGQSKKRVYRWVYPAHGIL
jgi:hypothetical protein